MRNRVRLHRSVLLAGIGVIAIAGAACRLHTEPAPAELAGDTAEDPSQDDATAASASPSAAGSEVPAEVAKDEAAADPIAPDFALPSHDDRVVTLDELVRDGPAVVVFYRGHW